MNTALILTRTDPEVKLEAQKIAKQLGLSLSAVINRLLKEFIQKKRITYSHDKPTPYLEKILREARKDRSHDSPTFDNAKDAIEYLHKQIE